MKRQWGRSLKSKAGGNIGKRKGGGRKKRGEGSGKRGEGDREFENPYQKKFNKGRERKEVGGRTCKRGGQGKSSPT